MADVISALTNLIIMAASVVAWAGIFANLTTFPEYRSPGWRRAVVWPVPIILGMFLVRGVMLT